MTKKHERDEFHLHSVTPVGAFGVRKRGDDETPAILAPVAEGEEDLSGVELVHCTRRPNEPIIDLRPAYATTKGPAQVATDTYRKSYDRIFGKPKSRSDHDLN